MTCRGMQVAVHLAAPLRTQQSASAPEPGQRAMLSTGTDPGRRGVGKARSCHQAARREQARGRTFFTRMTPRSLLHTLEEDQPSGLSTSTTALCQTSALKAAPRATSAGGTRSFLWLALCQSRGSV